ncbi:MAG: hypothetical protein EOP87_00935 [Verrucomicrobiaceae bacterium]|nr:MAG: hypothetical protein EOP87_00935 [Verrucomicrobiaceae bacterium]
MSKISDNAEAIKARLNTAPVEGELPTPIDLTKVDVVVDRQKDHRVKVAKSVASGTGTAILILWDGWVNLDPNSRRPRLGHSYTIRVQSKPVIAGDEMAADDVAESIAMRLWQWSRNGHANNECTVGPADITPDEKYLIYDMQVTIPTSH